MAANMMAVYDAYAARQHAALVPYQHSAASSTKPHVLGRVAAWVAAAAGRVAAAATKLWQRIRSVIRSGSRPLFRGFIRASRRPLPRSLGDSRMDDVD